MRFSLTKEQFLKRCEGAVLLFEMSTCRRLIRSHDDSALCYAHAGDYDQAVNLNTPKLSITQEEDGDIRVGDGASEVRVTLLVRQRTPQQTEEILNLLETLRDDSVDGDNTNLEKLKTLIT